MTHLSLTFRRDDNASIEEPGTLSMDVSLALVTQAGYQKVVEASSSGVTVHDVTEHERKVIVRVLSRMGFVPVAPAAQV